MTFRELLSLYQKGELPKEQQEYVESEIEKHEAISEYLYDDSELPVLENAAPSEKNEKDTKQSEDFTRLIRKMIRRAFIKMGVTVGAVVLAAVMAVTCFFPDIVASFYYDPEKTVGYPSYATKTTQMALDLSVFTELFLPSTYRNDVIIDDEGYGNYHISIPETLSYDGKNTTVSGKLEKGKLTLYDPNLLAYPASNAFVLPKGAEGYYSMGAAGMAEEAFARLQKLDEYDYYTAYFSLSELMDYESFYEREIKLRRLLVFPPFCDIALLTLSHRNEQELMRGAKVLSDELSRRLAADYTDVRLIAFGPFEAPIYRADGQYRMRMVIKCKLNKRSRALFADLLCAFSREGAGTPLLSVDFNPSNL